MGRPRVRIEREARRATFRCVPPRLKVSMLDEQDIAHLLHVSRAEVKRTLRAPIEPERYRKKPLYSVDALDDALPPRRAARVRRAAAGLGWNLVPREKTVFGNAELMRFWHDGKNALKPWRVGLGSTQTAWWKCPEGPDHEFERVVHRSRKKGKWTGCPYCAGRLVSVTNCLATVAPTTAAQWHPTKNGARTPRDIVGRSSEHAWWKCPRGEDHVWRDRVSSRNRPDKAGGCPFCLNRRTSTTNTLANVAPMIAKQWYQKRNGDVTPRDVVAGSTSLFWWKCKKGPDHIWRQSPKARIIGRGCPACVGMAPSVTNSLATRYPALAKEWHPTRNQKLTAKVVVPGSGKRVWWQCSEGHSWRVQVNTRTAPAAAGGKARGCPICLNRAATPANSLAKLHPARAREWHPTKNGELTPKDVVPGSGKFAWWQCKRGHEWHARIKQRAIRNSGCPYCMGAKVAPEDSLAAKEPALAIQWHPRRNAPLTPRDVGARSGTMLWWRCEKNKRHVFQATVGHRIRRKDPLRCPICAGTRKLDGSHRPAVSIASRVRETIRKSRKRVWSLAELRQALPDANPGTLASMATNLRRKGVLELMEPGRYRVLRNP